GGCMAATEYCRITPEGNVTPCPYMDVVAGSVLEESFTTIWDTSAVFAELRETANLKGRCGACEFKDLCGGCRCRAFAATGDYLAEDPGCAYQPTGTALPEAVLHWDQASQDRLMRIPISFIRNKTRKGVEAYARNKGVSCITTEVMNGALSGMQRTRTFGAAPAFSRKPTHLV
ncbi:MAG: SPASM domain-containing protein, partial [Rhodothermaceae bacterium]|nr:SPASM domain-containing protein [Rhodothermaceae bacterium]